MKQPNPIKILLHGQKQWLCPFQMPLKELERVYNWLGRTIEWRKQQERKADKNTPKYDALKDTRRIS